ncbi:hypothetical protein D5074_09575 [Pectobacterium polaris]|nr:hypothetical protein D5074_09575 [Pectobacterium polaris]
MGSSICFPEDADLKHRFSKTDTNDFYRVHGTVPLKKNTQHKCGRTYAEGCTSITSLRQQHHYHPRSHLFVPK